MELSERNTAVSFGNLATHVYNSAHGSSHRMALAPTISQVHSQPRPAVALNSRWIIGLLTAVYLFWLLIRAVSQPAWLAELPDVVAEFLRLVEVGWLATLAVVWGVVWWQGRQADLRPLPSLSLEQLYNLQPAEFEQYVAQLFRQKVQSLFARAQR